MTKLDKLNALGALVNGYRGIHKGTLVAAESYLGEVDYAWLETRTADALGDVRGCFREEGFAAIALASRPPRRVKKKSCPSPT